MSEQSRVKLLGTYRTPMFKYGDTVECELRGAVQIVGLTSARIPWPKCKTRSTPAMILYGDLARAIRTESAKAVQYWFGVGQDRVWKWRRALGVDRVNEGTSALLSRNAPDTCQSDEANAKREPALKSAERAAKIAAAKRGKPRPPGFMAKLRAANVGRKQSDETREKRRATAKRRGTIPPGMKGPIWTAAELALLGTMPDAAVALQTRRTLAAVQSKRYALGIEFKAADRAAKTRARK